MKRFLIQPNLYATRVVELDVVEETPDYVMLRGQREARRVTHIKQPRTFQGQQIVFDTRVDAIKALRERAERYEWMLKMQMNEVRHDLYVLDEMLNKGETGDQEDNAA